MIKESWKCNAHLVIDVYAHYISCRNWNTNLKVLPKFNNTLYLMFTQDVSPDKGILEMLQNTKTPRVGYLHAMHCNVSLVYRACAVHIVHQLEEKEPENYSFFLRKCNHVTSLIFNLHASCSPRKKCTFVWRNQFFTVGPCYYLIRIPISLLLCLFVRFITGHLSRTW